MVRIHVFETRTTYGVLCGTAFAYDGYVLIDIALTARALLVVYWYHCEFGTVCA